jgi:hypothetical protein
MTHNSTATNSTYNKLAVQRLNEALCFVSSSVLADSLELRNRQLLVAAKRYPIQTICNTDKLLAKNIFITKVL